MMSCSSREGSTRKRWGDLLGRAHSTRKGRCLRCHRAKFSLDGAWGDVWEVSSVDFLCLARCGDAHPHQTRRHGEVSCDHTGLPPTKPHSSRTCRSPKPHPVLGFCSCCSLRLGHTSFHWLAPLHPSGGSSNPTSLRLSTALFLNTASRSPSSSLSC